MINAKYLLDSIRKGDSYREVFIRFGDKSYVVKGVCEHLGKIELYLKSNNYDVFPVSNNGDLRHFLGNKKNLEMEVVGWYDFEQYEINKVENHVGEVVIYTVGKGFVNTGIEKIKGLFGI